MTKIQQESRAVLVPVLLVVVEVTMGKFDLVRNEEITRSANVQADVDASGTLSDAGNDSRCWRWRASATGLSTAGGHALALICEQEKPRLTDPYSSALILQDDSQWCL